MGRFSYEDADKYGSNGSGGSYFKIENDREIKRVRLLGRDMNDFPGYAVHEVKIGDKRRLVNCLREYGDPVTACPLCSSRYKQLAKVFIPLYNLEDDEVQVWERGKTFFPKLASYCRRHKNVVNYITEVERNGKPRDTNTTYDLYEAEEQDEKEVSLDDFADDMPEIMGRYILDKSEEELNYFLDYGDFPEDSSEPIRRRRSDSEDSEPTYRRTSRRSRNQTDGEF